MLNRIFVNQKLENMRKLMFIIVIFFMISSCSSKRGITYLNELDSFNFTDINKQKIAYTIQADDILSIEVHSILPEASVIYNRISQKTGAASNINLLPLEGYLISSDYTINFPVLGILKVEGTISELEKKIAKLLSDGGHLTIV